MATINQSSSILVLIFMGENYDFWRVKIMIFFCSQDLWDIIEHKFIIPLQQEVADIIFSRIMGVTSARKAWNTLDKVFNVKLQSLRPEFELIKMKEYEIVKDYYSRIKEIISQLRA
uniref:DUF4219 domain-containing protein n=1 Tax=Cajanus cajan TaxID=3821 RepID=A0A151QXA4_CAJCA|nr:hypothetical protein KK1_043997 [Cajanus cajan]